MKSGKFGRILSLVLSMFAGISTAVLGQDSEPTNSEPQQNFSEPEPAVDSSSQPPENTIEPPSPDDGGGATEFSE